MNVELRVIGRSGTIWRRWSGDESAERCREEVAFCEDNYRGAPFRVVRVTITEKVEDFRYAE